MKTASIYGAFNARWLEPEDVARSFVPTAPFKSLVHLQNSLLMGPRGCGKTTLLKMLTRRAQHVWQSERLQNEPQWRHYPTPDFEAIYIPSDVRWSAELSAVSKELADFPIDAERVQRSSVALAAVIEATRVFQLILDEHDLDPTTVLKALIVHLGLGPTVPSFREIRLRLIQWIDEIHSRLVRHDTSGIRRHLDDLPAALTSHSLSAVTKACSVFAEYAQELAPTRWALCFDELEIAPRWLQAELFEALRSFDQRFLLKLTWSPVLPTDLMPKQERQHDYAAIRMWHGHAADARPFCKEFSTRLLQYRLASPKVTPGDVFGTSPFAQEDIESDPTYSRGAPIWRAMIELAKRDATFREYLVQHGINPDDPIAETVSQRDESLRKVKPIVLLREAYLKDSKDRVLRRSRKNPLLYYGEDAIYAMSEGNPRLLAGLLSELLDVDSKPLGGEPSPVKPETQSRILHSASQRMLTRIKTYPVERRSRKGSLSGLIEKLGHYLHSELVTQEFRADPVGSFFVDQEVSPHVLAELSVGLLIGAFVHVKSPQADIATSVVGSRLRLSYMLAPAYRLLFRNYRETRLSTALRISTSSQRLLYGLDGNFDVS
jgi:hypothetical protein